MNNKLICAIFVTYNCDKEFYECFNRINKKVDKVVIVDNGSKSETLNILKDIKVKNDIELILNEENLGIAVALNIGVKYAIANNYEWVITLDHDSKITGDMIDKMFDQYHKINDEERKKIVSIVPNFIEETLAIQYDETSIENDYEYVENGITSGNLVKVSAFEEIGLFDEKLFIDCVDSDLCCRIIENGYKILQVNKAILLHNLGEVKIFNFFGRKIRYTNHSFIRRYYITRNRLYLWDKYKNITPDYIKFDKGASVKEIIKIILFEEKKLLKTKMIFKGYSDYKKNIFGKINI